MKKIHICANNEHEKFCWNTLSEEDQDLTERNYPYIFYVPTFFVEKMCVFINFQQKYLER